MSNCSGDTVATDSSTDGSTSHKKGVVISAILPSMGNVFPIKYCS